MAITKDKITVDFGNDAKQLHERHDWIERLFALGNFLREHFPNYRINIYAYESDAIGGLRIAEISLLMGNGGASWMRSDDDARIVIARCEDFAATYGIEATRPPGWSSCLNEHGDARIALLHSIGKSEEADAEYQRQLAEEESIA